MIADDDNGPARNGILLRPETDTSDGNLTRSFVPRRIALCPTTLEVREPDPPAPEKTDEEKGEVVIILKK